MSESKGPLSNMTE